MDKQTLPIDKGWAWVIVIATCGSFGIVAGNFKSQGIVLVELTERFPESSATALLWIFSLSSVINKSSGIFVSWLISKTSHRTVALTGTLLMVLGHCCTAYAPSVWIMYFTYSCGAGLGFGMLALTSLLATGPYFDKRRALAVGLTASGSGICTLLIPNLMRFLFDNMDFSGAFLVYGGFLMHTFILGCLLRPMSMYERKRTPEKQVDAQLSPSPTNNDQLSAEMNVIDSRTRSSSFHGTPGETVYHPELLSLRHLNCSTTEGDHKKGSRVLSVGDLTSSVLITEHQEKEPPAQHFHWKLLCDPRLLMVTVSIFLVSCGTGLIYQCIAPLARSRGVEKETVAIVLAVAGAMEIPCRIANGWFADLKLMSALSQYSLCNAITGSMALLCASVSGLPGMILMMAGMSSVGTSVYSLLPVISTDMFGKDRTASAMGILLVGQSASFIVSTPIAGFLFETFGWWEPVFFYISAVLYLSALTTAPYCIVNYCRQRTKPKHDVTEEKLES